MTDLVFGKYEIQHRLAIGGMGEVFYAVQKGVPGFERPAILKSLLQDLAQQEGFIDQFLDEARVAATLNHPNVVSIYEVGLWNGTYFIAMEYIRGRNLAQLIRKTLEAQQRVPPMVAARIIRDACLGLDHAHRAVDTSGKALNIIHRDISPQNIMVRDDGVTKVVDFGIASASNRATRTATGALKGKLAYMAPEQIVSRDITGKVDQYALGVVLWEMLTSKRLFKADSDILIARKVLEEPIPAPSTISPDISPELDALVMRMLARPVADRFPSCIDAAKALETLVTNAGTPETAVTDFMRQLGTEDLVVKVKSNPSQGNFVISLQPGGPKPPPVPADMTAPGVTPAPSSTKSRTGVTKKKRGVGVFAALAALAGLVPLAYLALQTPAPKPVLDAGAPIVAPPPVVVVVAADAGAPKRPGKLKLTVEPKSASIRIDGRGVSVQEVELSADVEHYLLVEAPRCKTHEAPVVVKEAEEKELIIKLECRAAPVAQPQPPPRQDDPRPPPAPVAQEPGFISVDTTPWSKVTIDGEAVGSTPVFKRKVNAGKHVVKMTNEGAGFSEQRTIDVAPGAVVKVRLP